MNQEIRVFSDDVKEEAEADDLQAQIEALEQLSLIADKWHRELIRMTNSSGKPPASEPKSQK